MNKTKYRNGQVWIETVIYTAIGLSLIAMVLAFVTPKINQARDKLLIEQSIRSLQELDQRIQEVMSKGDGNVRTIDFTVKRGVLSFNTTDDKIFLIIPDITEPYSEPGVPIQTGEVMVLTEKDAQINTVVLTLSYQYNLTYNGNDLPALKQFTMVPRPYTFSVANKENRNADVIEISKS
jgi:hypothetical protein